MLYENSTKKWTLVCDLCEKPAGEKFDSYWDAMGYKLSNDWKSRIWAGEGLDVCTECVNRKEAKP